MAKKVFFKTFGCRTNIYDTQVMMQNLKDFEVTRNEEEAQIVVVNSCTVTNGADSGVRSYINALNRKGKQVYIGGCGAFSKGADLFAKEKVFGVFGHSEKENLNKLLQRETRFVEIGDLTSLDETIVEEYLGKNKAFIKIQEGCDFRCSYCIIPYVRGNARSQNESKILEQIEKLASNGYGEFILTGTNIGSYGKDKGSSLGKLVQNIGKIRGVRRLRLGSIEPVQIDESFREILHEPWLERHLHIALQHTNEEMLRIMRRRNNTKDDLELFYELQSLGFALGTDFIVGHPGESEERWEDGLKKIQDFPLTHIHAFIYSKRDGTPSAKLKDEIRGDVSKTRLKALESIIEQKNYEFRLKNKKSLDILVEEQKNGLYTGFDQYYNKIYIKSDRDISKEWIEIGDYDVRENGNFAEF
ncbi:tRNA (N(6)-L-threonylcarbamoyladenosine(37)-C(2))-methylthiotransferase MtaB [Sulfurospirillum sp. 1612]|uniref:tRNA (N(6)-L-threonylcarbamoyladenosine(37)-C(2))- methylthiotransferase MtaB n=1 Tax=Sulfurospirillum sp. 1612 TaxID=3094835 RepID=UPI002F95ED0D